MKKNLLIIIAAVICLLASCSDTSDNHPNKPNIPDNKTFVVFDNTQGICAVSVFDDYRRRDEDKIVEIPIGNSSLKIARVPGGNVPFYFSYAINLKDISGFTLNYVPEIGRDQKAVRIDADKTTTVKVPTLSETFSSPDKLLSNDSYLFIKNNSSYSFELHRGTSKLKPDNISSSVVNDGEMAHYTINPGPSSNYSLLVNGDNKEFSDSIVNFEAGHIYNFDYNGSTISLVNDIELKLENVNGFTIPQPPAAPVVITSNGFLTLRWTAVENATAYEIWMSTENNSASASKYGTDVTGSLSAVISGLNNGTAYYIWLKAKNNIGTSGFSPVAVGIPSASTVKPPDPETAPTVIAGDGQLTVSWQAVEDASVYEIWAGTTNNSQTATKRGEDVAGLSAVISSLNNGTIYYIWIKAKNGIGVSGYSPSVNGKPIGTPDMPTVSPDYNGLQVKWTAVSGADEYEVYYGIDTATTLAATTAGTTANITGLTNGTAYYVCLRAKNISGVSDYGPTANGVPIGNTGVVTVNSGDGQLSLSWASVDGADQYEVYYSTTNSLPASPTQIISTTNATISGLTNGTTYYFWVKGKNTSGTSNTSTVVSGKPIGTPGAPTVNPDYKGLQITWTAVAGADEYEVYYGTTNVPVTLARTITRTEVGISGLNSGTIYYVRLKAKNANGVSDYGPSTSGVPENKRSPGLYRNEEKIGTQNLADSLTYISANAVSGDNFYIVLGADESVSPKTLSYSNKTVGITLLGYGGERTITLNTNGSLFIINSGVTLTLDENITLVGRNANSTSLVGVSSNATLIMNNGAKINANNFGNSNGSGSGVNVTGTFIMNGGVISGNTAYSGGGIYISAGTLTMNGGVISGNTASTGGGIYISGGTVTMNGGTISGNNARGGGIFMNGGTVTMYGGAISGNTSNSQGGGIEVSRGSFTMYGGIISGNTASSYGGGIFVGSATFRKLPFSGGQNSGIIYGSEAVEVDADGIPLKNTGDGSAVYSSSRQRNTTAEQTDHIDSTTGKGLSAYGNPPYGQ